MGNVNSMKARAKDQVIAINLRHSGLLEERAELEHYYKRIASDAYALFEIVDSLCKPPPKPLALKSDDLRNAAEQVYNGLDTKKAFNIAIFGSSGTGKMTFINALLGHPRNSISKTSSPEGDLKTAIQLAHPQYNHIRTWYFPDQFDEKLPEPDYYMKQCLYGFDIILFLVSNQVRLTDVEVAKQAISADPATPIAFVYAKSDTALLSGIGHVREESEWDAQKGRVANRIRTTLRKQMDEADLREAEVFLVSQDGILQVNAGEKSSTNKYLVDDYQLYYFLAKTVKEGRYGH